MRKMGFSGFKDETEPGFELTDVNIYDELKNEINFGTIGTLNKRMWEIEAEWDGIPREDKTPDPDSVAGLLKQIVEIYSNGFDAESKPENHNKGIGCFTNPEEMIREGDYLTTGTGFDRRAWITIPLPNGRKKAYKYALPIEETFKHDLLEYKAAFFGERGVRSYIETLSGDVIRILEDYGEILKQGKNPDEMSIIDAHMVVIQAKYINAFKAAEEKIREFESRTHYKLMSGRSTVENMFQTMGTIKNKIMAKRLPHEEVHYTHTYKIIDVEATIIENGQSKNFAQAHPNWVVRDKEFAHGLDENGRPLEVGDGRTGFRGGVLKENTVLIDIFHNWDVAHKELTGVTDPAVTVREVDPRFIKECHPIDIAVYVYAHYDSYRDDMRDGRYHKDSMSIMEYLMENLDPLEPKNVRDYVQKPDFDKRVHAKVRVQLNKRGTGQFRPTTDPDVVHETIKSTHLNPAFDLKNATGKAIHWGRKYYYDGQDQSVQSKEPTITTRAAALYILHRVIDQTKYWGDSGNKEGVRQILAKIADQTKGYDIGANLGRWGKPLTKDPFRPGQSG